MFRCYLSWLCPTPILFFRISFLIPFGPSPLYLSSICEATGSKFPIAFITLNNAQHHISLSPLFFLLCFVWVFFVSQLAVVMVILAVIFY